MMTWPPSLEQRALLAFEEWKVGCCLFLCSLCSSPRDLVAEKLFHTSASLGAHLIRAHKIGYGEHRRRFGSSRVVTEHLSCKLCGQKVVYEPKHLRAHFRRRHAGTDLKRYFVEHVYCEAEATDAADREGQSTLLLEWQRKRRRKGQRDGLERASSVQAEEEEEKEDEEEDEDEDTLATGGRHVHGNKKDAGMEEGNVSGGEESLSQESTDVDDDDGDDGDDGDNGAGKDVRDSEEEEDDEAEEDCSPPTVSAVDDLCEFSCKLCPLRSNKLNLMSKHAHRQHRRVSKKGDCSYYRAKTVWHLCKICSAKIGCTRKIIADHVNHKHGIKLTDYVALPPELVSKKLARMAGHQGQKKKV